MPLTDTECKNARCPAGKARARFADSEGLYLEVLPAGGKYWRLKYRFQGKEKRLALGVYPEVKLSEVRAARAQAKLLLASGKDPSSAKQDQKLAKRLAHGNSFEAIARAWFEHWRAGRSERHAGYVLRRLEVDVFPEIGSRAAADITAPMLVGLAKKIESRGADDVAKRALQTCGQVFRYAVAHGLIDRNPAADVKPSDALRQRASTNHARVEARDLPDLLRKTQAYAGTPYTRFALQLMALTFVRTAELVQAQWGEFDLDAAEWRIPAARMKMRLPHIVPLSRQAVEVLQCLGELRSLSPFVFPGERDHERPMSTNTLLKALERMGFKGRMTGHGFRGLASTCLHEMGHRHDFIELQLAHQDRNAVSAAYNHATYLSQRREMMQAWADYLDAQRAGARVVPIGKAA